MIMESHIQAEVLQITKHDLVGIYEQHSAGLYRYAYRLLGDKNIAEEAVSETFSRFLQAIRNGGGPRENVKAYLYRVTHNYITDIYRRQPPEPDQLDVDKHPDESSNPVNLVNRQIEQEHVRKALLKLSADQRQVVLLRLIEDWPHEDVAIYLGKSIEATRALQYRALSALRRLLLEEEEMQ